MPRDRRSSPNRSMLGHWVPLVMTVTVATIGIAAWVWKERNDADDDEYRHDGKGGGYAGPAPDYTSQPPAGHTGYAPGVEPNGPPPPQGPGGPGVRETEDETVLGRMQGAFRRTPSPQQIFDGASKKVATGMAAAGAMVAGALSSIREEDHHYEDHSRWSEQRASLQREQIVGGPGAGAVGVAGSMSAPAVPTLHRSGYRKTVVIVISSVSENFEAGTGMHTEHASLLSHLPAHIDEDTRVFVLIFSPTLRQHPLSNSKPPPSVASSFSHIGHEDLQTPGGEDEAQNSRDEDESSERPLQTLDPQPAGSSVAGGSVGGGQSLGIMGVGGGTGSAMAPIFGLGATNTFKALYTEAQTLVSRDTMIMPFTTPSGWVQVVKHLHPDVVYVQMGGNSNLGGARGEEIKEANRWVGEFVLVVGDDSGHGGLVDSEDEYGPNAGARGDAWWQNDVNVGLGKGIEVVEGMRIGEDWRRRVRGHD